MRFKRARRDALNPCLNIHRKPCQSVSTQYLWDDHDRLVAGRLSLRVRTGNKDSLCGSFAAGGYPPRTCITVSYEAARHIEGQGLTVHRSGYRTPASVSGLYVYLRLSRLVLVFLKFRLSASFQSLVSLGVR